MTGLLGRVDYDSGADLGQQFAGLKLSRRYRDPTGRRHLCHTEIDAVMADDARVKTYHRNAVRAVCDARRSYRADAVSRARYGMLIR